MFCKQQTAKSTPLSKEWGVLILCSDFLFEFLDAFGADVLAFVVYNAFCTVAENAGGMVLVEDDIVTVNKYLECVFFGDVQSAA